MDSGFGHRSVSSLDLVAGIELKSSTPIWTEAVPPSKM